MHKLNIVAVVLIFVIAHAMPSHALEATATRQSQDLSGASKTAIQKAQIAALTTVAQELQKDVAELEKCQNAKKLSAPSSADADADGCVTFVPDKLGFSTQLFRTTIRTTGRSTKNLGVHDLCILNVYSGPGGYDTVCNVWQDTSTQEWMFRVDDLTSAETQTCAAYCLNWKR